MLKLNIQKSVRSLFGKWNFAMFLIGVAAVFGFTLALIASLYAAKFSFDNIHLVWSLTNLYLAALLAFPIVCISNLSRWYEKVAYVVIGFVITPVLFYVGIWARQGMEIYATTGQFADPVGGLGMPQNSTV